MINEDNRILNHMRIENITDTNIFIKAVIVYVGKKDWP